MNNSIFLGGKVVAYNQDYSRRKKQKGSLEEDCEEVPLTGVIGSPWPPKGHRALAKVVLTRQRCSSGKFILRTSPEREAFADTSYQQADGKFSQPDKDRAEAKAKSRPHF